LAHIYEVEKLSFGVEAYSVSSIESLLRCFRKTFFVAEVDGRIVGYAVAVKEGNIGHVYSIAVHPSFRSMGVGRILLSRLIERLRKMRVSTVKLEVKEDNLPARRLYESLGFNARGVVQSYYSDRKGAVIMVKSLK
jgi:ribosomal-protein-alanine N-acetyltransferase